MTDFEKYGFRLIRSTALDELDAMLYQLSHVKSGAELIYFDREDDNKTFAIGFSTPPTDDTGVFHIIEHSVLCGSEKYPLNDPFAELLKGSLNTFLNAVTYEDRTIYPVSSRCERDFINLVDVYMDAVLAPNMLKNPSIFRQEGWHYEYDTESDALSLNGVVYNEMKGAYSSPDEIGAVAINRALFDGTPYSKNSGGDPEAISSLTYEQFKATYEKHYHPSNSKIMLDGRVDLDKLLPLIDAHLCLYDKRESIAVPERSKPGISPTVTVNYEISENEEESGKARVLYGYVYADHFDKDAHLTASVLCDILCDSNASPLKKALLDSGVAKDAAMYCSRSREQTLVIEVRDADESHLDEIDGIISNVISSLASGGIDKKNLISSLNSIEFRLRERDYGALPTGIVLAMSMYSSWMYGGDPEDALLMNETLASVREKIDTDHFERSLLEMTVNNRHKAKVIMLPDKTLARRSTEAETARLNEILRNMSDEEKERIMAEEAELRLWQESEPNEAAINSLPTLTLADIPEKSSRPFALTEEIDGVKIIRSPIKTNGIVYLSLLFDSSDLQGEELITLSMLSAALLNFPTRNYDALSLQNEVKAKLGGLFSTFAISGNGKSATPYLKIGAKALTASCDDVIFLVNELLLNSVIEDTREMTRIILQTKSHMEDAIISSGEAVALGRIEAGRSEKGAIVEHLSGYEAYLTLCKISESEDAISKLTADCRALLKKLISKKRLTISVAGDADEGFIKKLISSLPDSGEAPTKKPTHPCDVKNEYFLLPSKIAYAALGGESEKASERLGIMRVVRSMLSYEYLWNTVRVQGGAYGTGFVPRMDGGIFFYSYRDPSPARSLEFYKQSTDYLRTVANSGADITKFIIGAIGEYDTLITPRTAATIVTADYLGGWTKEKEDAVRRDMLNMTAADLLTAADIIDEVISDSITVIVGGKEHLDSLDTPPERIHEI